MVHKSELHVTRHQMEKALQLVNPRFKLQSYREINHGIINRIYFLKNQRGKEFVLRICNPLWEEYKIRKEAAAYTLLKKRTTLPIPRLLASDTTKTVMPFTYNLWSKVDGENMSKAFDHLSKAQQRRVFEQVAKYLIQMHRISFRSFGDIALRRGSTRIDAVGEIATGCTTCDAGPFSTWKALFAALAERYAHGVEATQFKRYAKPFRNILACRIDVLDRSVMSRFLHKDYGLHNMIGRNGRITAVLDFEWALAGDSEFEYASVEVRYAEQYPDAFAWFKKIYTKAFPLSPEYERKRVLYNAVDLLIDMESFDWLYKNTNPIMRRRKFIEQCRSAEEFIKTHQ